MNSPNKSLAAAELLKKIRTVTAANLPIGHSFIPYDILLCLFHCQSIEETMTVKSLFASLPYSDMGTRYHFNRLVTSGWIELVINERDPRMKVCRPTEKFNSRFWLIVEELAKVEWFQIHMKKRKHFWWMRFFCLLLRSSLPNSRSSYVGSWSVLTGCALRQPKHTKNYTAKRAVVARNGCQ